MAVACLAASSVLRASGGSGPAWVTVASSDTTMGTVAISLSGATGSGTLASPYALSVMNGTNFNVTATPKPGYQFVRWQAATVTLTGGGNPTVNSYNFTGTGYTTGSGAGYVTYSMTSTAAVTAGFGTTYIYVPVPYGWDLAPGGLIQAVFVPLTPTTFSFSNLLQTFDGTVKSASVISTPNNATYNTDLTKGPAVGSYTVSATAYGNFSGSGSATLTIQPLNRAPMIAWVNPVSTAYVNQWFNIQAQGNDLDGNISYVDVWKNGQPFALDGFPNGSTQYSDNNAAMSSVPGTVTFTAQAGDSAGATSPLITTTVTIIDRAPTVTISASPTAIIFGQTTKATAIATDLDGNLAFQGILTLFQDGSNWYRGTMCDHSTGWGNHPTTTSILSASYTSGVISGGTNTEWIIHQPQWVGTITYHTNAYDGYYWASSDPTNWAACIGYAYVTVSKATPTGTFQSQTFPTTHTLTAADLNAAFVNPFSTGVAAPTGTVTYNYPAGTVLYPGTYTVTASYPGDANYNSTSVSATFTVANTAPTAAMSIKGISSGTTTAVMGETLTINVSGADTDGNLLAVNLWVLTPSIGWRNIRADSTVAAAFTENATTDNAITSASNVPTLGGANRTFTILLGGGTGTYQFCTRSMDATGTASASQVVYVTVSKANQSGLVLNAASSQTYGTTQTLSTSGGSGTAGVSYAIVGQSAAGVATLTGASLTANTGTGWVTLQATNPGDQNYNPTSSNTVTVTFAKATATVTLGNFNPMYDGTAKAVTATTTPPGLAVNVTYNGSATAPTNVLTGGYAVVATINDLNYAGSATGTLNIQPVPVTFTFSNTALYYNGQQQAPLIGINPTIATTTITGTSYATLPNPYSFTITANGNYTGSGTCNWAIGCCPATVTLGNLNFIFDGTQKIPTYSTLPVPLSCALTYALLPSGNPSITAPTHAGSYTVLATVNSGPDANGKVYLGSTTGTMVIAKINQAALTLNASTPQTYGTTQTLGTTGGSGTGAVTYAIVNQSAAGVATLSGAVLTANTGTGWVDVQATKALDTDYNVTTSNVVRVNFALASQAALTLNANPTQTYNTTQLLSTTGGSTGGTVTYTVTPTPAGVATLSGAVLTAASGTGTADVQATMAGNSNYSAVTSSVVRVTLAKANQAVLTLNANPTQTYNTSQTLTTSGGTTAGTVTYSVTPTPAGVATLAGAVLTATSGTGTADVQATMAGNTNYNAVTSSVVRVTLAKANQATLTLNANPTQTYNTTQTLSTMGGTTAGTVTYSVTPTPAGVATLAGAVLTAASGTGTADVQATMAGNTNYNAVTSSVVRVTLAKANQATLTLNANPTQTYNTTQTLSTTGGSTAGTVTYSVTPTPAGVATLSGAVLTAASGTGTADVQATMAGNTNYNAVTSSVVRVTLAKAAQAAVTINSAATGTYGVPYTATATGGSGTGTLIWSLGTGSTATTAAINSFTGAVTCTTAGTVVFNVYRTADTNYLQSATSTNFTLTLNLDAFSAWELSNGLNPYSTTALMDSDHDGLTNIAEYNLSNATTVDNPTVYNQGPANQGDSLPAGWPNGDANPTLAVGTTSGSLNVDKSGALGYSVPIWTTPGTAGMEPKVSLNYSSQSGPGIAGFGWSLSGVSAISRGGQTKAIDGQNVGASLTANDRFYLDGQRLILISGTYGAANSEYRTEIDSFTKVVAVGSAGSGPASFKAWTKAGLIIEFGNTTDSARATSDGRTETISWSVNKISDTKGNYINFVYTQDRVAGTQVLARINYTGSTSVLPYASLRFEYEGRPDSATGYAFGSVMASLQRLKAIKSYFGETVARTYALAYTTSASANSRSLLASITETGADGKAMPPLTFTYEAPTGGWSTAGYSTYTPPFYRYLAPPDPLAQQGVATGAGFMDLNGDGYPDFVLKRLNSDGTIAQYGNYAYLNSFFGWAFTPSSTPGMILPDYRLPGIMTLAWDGRPDAGARFVDLNGDGLVDIIASFRNSNGVVNNYCYLNTGAGWAYSTANQIPTTDPTYYVSGYGKADSGRRYVDVNGDGLPDLVWNSDNPSEKGCLINNINGQYQAGGPAWVRDDRWAPPFVIAGKYSSGSQFMDLNGDGLPDLVQYGLDSNGNIEVGIALNSPTGFTNWNHVTGIAPGTYFSTYQAQLGATLGKFLPPTLLTKAGANYASTPIGSEVVDLNGDGLPDIIMSNPQLGNGLGTAQAWLNTGNGWVPAPNYVNYNIELLGGSTVSSTLTSSTGAIVADLNGDGLPDLACYKADGGPMYFLNTGHGWSTMNNASVAHLELPTPVTNADPTVPTGFQLIDLNADGIADIVNNTTHYYNLAKPTADKLTKVTNGFGVSASVSYSVLTETDASGNPTVYTKGTGSVYPVTDVTGPMLVVNKVTNDDGVGGQYPVSYKYAGLRSDALHGSLGFASMTVTDGRTNIVSTTNFAQTYPFIGMPISSTTTSGTVNLSQSLVSYAQLPLNGGLTKFVYAADSLSTTTDLNGTVVSTVDTSIPTTGVDSFGNITQMTVTTSDSTGTQVFKKATTNVYATADTTNWYLGRLTSATVTSSAPGTADITRNSSFHYDPTSGLLDTETVQPGDATQTLTTTYGFDSFGNKNSVTVAGYHMTVDVNGNYSAIGTDTRTTTTQYDINGRFPLWTKNALGHQENYNTYDQNLGVLKQMTGANGLPTTWDYDGFGRKIHEHRADGTDSYVNYRWVTAAPAGAATYTGGTAPTVKYSVENTATGVAPSLAFYDSFGRAFLGLGINGNGKVVYQTTTFDSMGRAYAKSNPYFNDGSTKYWAVTTSFDLLNRPLTVQTPDDENGTQTSSVSYNGLTTTATDPKGRVSQTIKNAAGWTVSNIRNLSAGSGAADYSATTYTYDALGNLATTNAAGITTYLYYDLRGRKTSMIDSDMGGWSYKYSIFGELIWQKDPKGQIVTMAYDNLGRLVSRVEPEGTTTWTYDTAANGAGVWKGKLASVSAPGGYGESYSYDPVGRPLSSTRTIDGIAYTMSTTYDSVGRPVLTNYPATPGIGSGQITTRNVYNGYGYLKEIRGWLPTDDGKANSQLQGPIYWQADHFDVSGRIDGESYGNGLSNDRYFSAASGRLRSANIDDGRIQAGPYAVQQLAYSYDAVGNVKSRIDSAPSVLRTEYFSQADGSDGYDGLDRLRIHRVSGGASVSVAYDQKGNITSKSDVGLYSYSTINGGPHAVTSAGTYSSTLSYDANGNLTTMSGGTTGNRTFLWTSFNQLQKVTDSVGKSSEFFFGAGHERVKQIRRTGTTVTDTTIYIGSLYEKITTAATGLVEHKHYIMSPSGRIAVLTLRSDFSGDTRYFHTDGLGSITVVTDEYGTVLTRYAYDAWGKQSTLYSNSTPGLTDLTPSTRGFTDHEMLNNFGLIHMNGRVYDATLGRFISADPNVDGASDAQGYNKYSYVANDPINKIDPDGREPAFAGFGPVDMSQAYMSANPAAVNRAYANMGPTMSPQTREVVTGGLTVVGSVPTMLGGAALSETGLGAIIGVPTMLAGSTAFGLGMAQIAHGLSGDDRPVGTPNGAVPGGILELSGAVTGNPNIQAFGGMADSLFPLPTDGWASLTGINIVLNPPEFNPNAWPFAPAQPPAKRPPCK